MKFSKIAVFQRKLLKITWHLNSTTGGQSIPTINSVLTNILAWSDGRNEARIILITVAGLSDTSTKSVVFQSNDTLIAVKPGITWKVMHLITWQDQILFDSRRQLCCDLCYKLIIQGVMYACVFLKWSIMVQDSKISSDDFRRNLWIL